MDRGWESVCMQGTYLEDIKRVEYRDFPGGPMVRTPCFHCRGQGFHPWWGN